MSVQGFSKHSHVVHFYACVHLYLQEWKQLKLCTLNSARQLLEGILHSKGLESKENVYSAPKEQVNFPLSEEVHACLQHLICNLVVALKLSELCNSTKCNFEA